MDAIGPVTAATSAATGAAPADTGTQTIQAGYSSSISSDVAAFEGSLQAAAVQQGNESTSVMKTMMEPLDHINKEASALIEYAETAVQSGNELTPSEIVMLTAKSQEFMFHSQLTANIANRTADGLQQLFRQQS